MCHLITLSTTRPDDLREIEQACCVFEPLDADDPIGAALEHPHRWFVACRFGGCSCHFRHAHGPALAWDPAAGGPQESGGWVEDPQTEPSFGPPEDWSPEDADDVRATAEFWEILRSLAASGDAVEVVCVWEEPPGTEVEVRTWDVSLREVPRESFRFHDGWRFRIRP
ncbi:MAG: hypothetical protein KIS66_05275 [Fimbriimonadaceae bacterium]|nr:hypothetical protein [Fimbriimonadaceae bacterium]